MEKKISNYINKMENYYNANKLKINTSKTQIMILGKNNFTVNGSLELDGKTVSYQHNIKILGTLFSQSGNWNDNFVAGSNSLLTQLKRRANAVVKMSKNFYYNFKIQIMDAIILGKMRYNLATWGQLNMKNKNKINNIIKNTVKRFSIDKYFGKSTEYIMKENKILDYFQ